MLILYLYANRLVNTEGVGSNQTNFYFYWDWTIDFSKVQK
jgi:hypothetical protein